MLAKIRYLGFFFSILTIIVLTVIFFENTDEDTKADGKALIQDQSGIKPDQFETSNSFDGDKSQIISLHKGEASFTLEYSGYSTFKAKILQLNGSLVANLSDANGPYHQTQIIDIPETGDYLLNVMTTGEWSYSKE